MSSIRSAALAAWMTLVIVFLLAEFAFTDQWTLLADLWTHSSSQGGQNRAPVLTAPEPASFEAGRPLHSSYIRDACET